jgi:hypothetical protein
MFFWFAGLSFLLVAWIFASPLLDYRLVMAGSVLPVAEKLLGGPWALHTLLAPVVAMTAVMVAWRGRRLRQRRWLGLPIGLFLFLVLDGAWTNTKLFWWPAFGWGIGEEPGWRPFPALLLMEAAGLAALVIAIRRFGLVDESSRARFARTGHLPRA